MNVPSDSQSLLLYLDDCRTQLAASLDRVPADRRSIRPSADRWSVAEVIEHLAIVEARVVDRLSARASAGPVPPVTASNGPGITDAQLAERLLNRDRRFMTSEAGQPRSGLDASAAWAALEQTRSALKTLVASVSAEILDVSLAPHPAFGSLTFRQWVMFSGGHDARHALQIDEIGDTLLTTGPGPQAAGLRRQVSDNPDA
jgi:hypothetical protein